MTGSLCCKESRLNRGRLKPVFGDAFVPAPGSIQHPVSQTSAVPESGVLSVFCRTFNKSPGISKPLRTSSAKSAYIPGSKVRQLLTLCLSRCCNCCCHWNAFEGICSELVQNHTDVKHNAIILVHHSRRSNMVTDSVAVTLIWTQFLISDRANPEDGSAELLQPVIVDLTRERRDVSRLSGCQSFKMFCAQFILSCWRMPLCIYFQTTIFQLERS